MMLWIPQAEPDSPRGSRPSSRWPLAASSLPDVRWEDIGGLDSIRKEILDVVELPLKHPHLFDGSAHRRSGILLFGPPGTGARLRHVGHVARVAWS